jgi:uncharacterized protein
MVIMADSPPSFLVVDGNNVIHSWPKLSAIYRHRRFSAYLELVKILESYQDFSDHRVVVVFDGRGVKIMEEREKGSVQIFYSAQNMSADSIIERLAAGNAQRYHIVVATDDVSIQDAVVASGGEAVSTKSLADRIKSCQREMNRWLKTRRRKD